MASFASVAASLAIVGCSPMPGLNVIRRAIKPDDSANSPAAVDPQIAISLPVSGAFANAANETALPFAVTCAPKDAAVKVRSAGVDLALVTCPEGALNGTVDVSTLAEGPLALEMIVLADDGATEAATSSVTITKDTIATAPTVTRSSGASGMTATSDFLVAGVEAGAEVRLYTNASAGQASTACALPALRAVSTATGTSTTLGSSTWSVPLATTGSYHFYAQYTDVAGNTSACVESADVYSYNSPAALAFTRGTLPSAVAYGSTADVSLTLSNAGTTAASSVSFAAVSAPYQRVTGGGSDCGTSLAAAATCIYTLRLTSPGQGASAFAATVTATYDNGQTAGQTASTSISITGAPLSVTIASKYSSFGNWNSWVDPTDSTACATTDSKCVHGGELKRITVPGALACSDLTLSVSPDTFNWTCDDSSGTSAIFASTGLREGKGLRDLLEVSAGTAQFKPMVATVARSGNTIASVTGTWWGNTVAKLTAGANTLGTANRMYVTDGAVSGSYTITANGVAIVSLGTDQITASASPGIALNGPDFVWIEANVNAKTPFTQAAKGISLANSTFSRVHRSAVANASTYGLELDTVDKSTVLGGSFANNGSHGIYVNGGSDNVVAQVNLSNNGGAGLRLNLSSRNILTQIVGLANTLSLIHGEGGSYNTAAFVTASSNAKSGIRFVDSTNSSVSQVLAANNGSGGLSYLRADGSAAQIVSAHNAKAVRLRHGWVTFSKGLRVNAPDCSTANTVGDPVGTEAACNTSLMRSGTLDYDGTVDLAGAFTGMVGGAQNSSSLAWNDIDQLFRGFGKTTSAMSSIATSGRCTGGTCQQWDLSLTGTPGSTDVKGADDYHDGQACPSWVASNQTMNYLGRSGGSEPFLINAMEIFGTGGNDNGLCESNEVCVYQGNFGAYAGSGATAGSCVYSGTSVSGVTLEKFATN